MGRITFLAFVVVVAVLLIFAAAKKCSGKKFEERVNAHEKCRKQGFVSKLDGCSSQVDGELKVRKKCKRLEKRLAKCDYKCPVNGGWGEFGDWSECSAECDGGLQSRSRICDNPAPANGGMDCEGEATQTRTCNSDECPTTGPSTTSYYIGTGTAINPSWDLGPTVKYYNGRRHNVVKGPPVPEEEEHIVSSCFTANLRAYGPVLNGAFYSSDEACVELCIATEGCKAVATSPSWDLPACVIIGDYTLSEIDANGWHTAERECFDSGFDKETPAPEEDECSLKSLGCWADNPTRAIAGGIRFNSNNPIEDCHNFAKEQGFSVFAVQYNTECFTAADADETFKQYGEANACQNGRGGDWAQNVYQVTCEDVKL